MNTRHGSNLHLPLANLDIYQKGVHYSGITIFNSLPSSTTFFIDNRKIKKNFYIQTLFIHYISIIITTVISRYQTSLHL
jgi:hypothetical protein